MNVNIVFRKIPATEALKSYVEKKTKKFFKYVTYPMEVHVIVSVEKPNHMAEITCHAEHKDLVAVAKTKDLYESIDLAIQKIETQLKKNREMHKGHKKAHETARRGSKLATDVPAMIPHREKNSA
jgi:putative sigma-54 modulation protein